MGVGILHRDGDNDTDGVHRGIIHAQVTEVYIILSGGGTLLTGGEGTLEELDEGDAELDVDAIEGLEIELE